METKNPEKKIKDIITAEFQIPSKLDYNSLEGGVIFPENIKRHTSQSCDITKLYIIEFNSHAKACPATTAFSIKYNSCGGMWQFIINDKWLLKLSSQRSPIRGAIRFRSKDFGSWEPFESIRYFVRPSRVMKIIESAFTVEQLEATLSGFRKTSLSENGNFTLELELTVVHDLSCGDEEVALNLNKTRMKNELLTLPKKSDFCIKVDDQEFLIHLKMIAAFSIVSKTLLKYVKGNECDWSDIMTPASMRALLRFVYYNDVNSICTPELTFNLLKFSHMYLISDLLKICQMRLTKFTDDQYTLGEVFEIYTFAREKEEFKDLEQHFCGVLSMNAKKYDRSELKLLTQGCMGELGLDILLDILQFDDN